jgi:hypothetical protein
MNTQFQVTDKQWKTVNNWIKKLPPAETGAIGGRVEFIFVPNSLGVGVLVRDLVTRKELDLSDYEKW